MKREEIQEACDALLCGRTFKTFTSRGYDVEVHKFNMFVDGILVAKIQNNELLITVCFARNRTTVELLNGLPNVNITGYEHYQLNGKEWDGRWFKVMDDLYKTVDDL